MNADDSDVPLFAELHEADPAVVEATREAKKTLAHFLDTTAKMRFSPATYLIKVPFIDRSDRNKQALIRTGDTASEYPTRPTCHLWLSVSSGLDELVFCLVGEAPDRLHLNRGASFVVVRESIEDWMINHGGEVFGGFSLRLIRSRLSEVEQTRFDAHTGIREFKTLTP